MSNEKPKFRRGLTTRLAIYFTEHPDKVITIAELEKVFGKDGWTRHQIMHAMATPASKKNPNGNPVIKKVERLQTGMWRFAGTGTEKDWDPEPPKKGTEAEQVAGGKGLEENQMTVEILAERANFILVEDVNDQKIYKMYLVG